MQQGQLQLRGQVQADQGLFILPDENTPSLGQDVLIVDPRQPKPTAAPAAASTSWIGTPDVQVTLDLGPDFRIEGLGLTTRLAGQVALFSNISTQGLPRLVGEVRTEGGRYKAYGQQLRIETGLLRFNGVYDNPQLDILAIRPNLSQRVGVRISGTAMNPKVRLYADPDMADADKLAWLVLGRSAAGGGAESAVLQQAALALFSSNGKTLSGEMANAMGLDEISLASGSRSDSTATGAAVTLGKRLSKDFYLVYETSLRGTFGSFYVFYDLSRRLTLRAQTGQDNALDLIYTVRKD
jgi:translocation and assembly module TamB